MYPIVKLVNNDILIGQRGGGAAKIPKTESNVHIAKTVVSLKLCSML